eukprot:COSAG01_NODE_5968_length_3926_cov_209.840345_5_plen_66_part_00
MEGGPKRVTAAVAAKVGVFPKSYVSAGTVAAAERATPPEVDPGEEVWMTHCLVLWPASVLVLSTC